MEPLIDGLSTEIGVARRALQAVNCCTASVQPNPTAPTSEQELRHRQQIASYFRQRLGTFHCQIAQRRVSLYLPPDHAFSSGCLFGLFHHLAIGELLGCCGQFLLQRLDTIQNVQSPSMIGFSRARSRLSTTGLYPGLEGSAYHIGIVLRRQDDHRSRHVAVHHRQISSVRDGESVSIRIMPGFDTLGFGAVRSSADGKYRRNPMGQSWPVRRSSSAARTRIHRSLQEYGALS
ncbi:MAG: hypothetical protein IPN78_17440 [Candidatus Accumulibacter sp.]|nr:hypothetical protein [Candidatus Accumulibacter propinquus]